MAPMEPEESRKGGGAQRNSADVPSADGEATAVEAAAADVPAAPSAGGAGRPPATDGATVPVVSADTTSAARRLPDTASPAATAGETDAASGTGRATAAKSAASTAASAESDTATGLVATGGRLSKPMVAAAGIAGVLLLCSPFLISQLTGHHDDGGKPPAAASEYDGQGRGAGVVPGADQPQGHQGQSDGGAASGGSGDGGQGGAPAGGDSAAYTAMAGPGCTDKSTGYKEHGTYADGDAGWTTHKSGGWTKDGCDGSFVSVPMAGDKGDDGNYTLWTFATGPVKSGSCQVRVHVPKDDDVKHVGGHPTRYSVFASAAATGKALGDFTVDQTKKRGDWASGGTFQISDGHFAVKLHTQGVDFGSGFDGAHHAASAVAVRCTG